jgi:hypothetical protein
MKVTSLKPQSGYRLWLHFADGIEGTVDLSSYVGEGVFAAWSDLASFASVRVGEFGQPVWDGDIDLCADALYRNVTGRLPAGFLVKGEPAHA